MIIGKFQKHDDGAISGEVDALLLGRAKLSLERSEQGPDYVVLLTDTERRIRMDPQGYIFVGHRVTRFEFPHCATGT